MTVASESPANPAREQLRAVLERIQGIYREPDGTLSPECARPRAQRATSTG
jgi:hypothetical protein